jgi:predicted MFS family arabinose efflux permease
MAQATQSTESTSQPLALRAMLDVLRVRDFRLLWLGEGISLIGDQFYLIAMPWLVLQITGSSGTALGVALMLAGIPRAIFVLVGGALSDRISPRLVMLASNALRGVLVGVLAALTLTQVVELWHVYALSFMFGLVDAFFHPAYASLPPRLVDGTLLEPANALLQVTLRLSLLIGPGLAGVLVARHGPAIALAFDAVTFAAAMVALLLMRPVEVVRNGKPDEATQSGDQPGIVDAIREGLVYVSRHTVLVLVLLMVAAVDFSFVGPITVGLPVLADTRFGDPQAYGVMLSAFGGGALLGIVIGGALQVRRLGVLFVGIMMIFALMLGTLGVAGSLPGIAALMAVSGIGSGIFNVKGISWIQRRTDPEMLARVMSLIMLSSVGLQPLSSMLAGLLVDVSAPVMFGGAGMLILAAALYLLSREEWRAVQSDDVGLSA